MPLGRPVYLFIPEVSPNPDPASLPQVAVLGTSLHSLRINQHLMTRLARIPLLITGGRVRSLPVLVRPVLIRKRVNLYRLLALRPMDMGALRAHVHLPPVKAGYLNHNLTRLAGRRVPSFRPLPIVVTRLLTPGLIAIIRQARLQHTRTRSLQLRTRLPIPTLHPRVLRSGDHRRHHARH